MHTNKSGRAGSSQSDTLIREMVARALGARYPVLVASTIGPDCADVPAAIAALRQRRPQWFEPAAAGSTTPGSAPSC